jgi:hypothetical protein
MSFRNCLAIIHHIRFIVESRPAALLTGTPFVSYPMLGFSWHVRLPMMSSSKVCSVSAECLRGVRDDSFETWLDASSLNAPETRDISGY